MLVAWIDPGATGAVAFLDTKSGKASVVDLPIMELGKKKVPNPYELADILDRERPDIVGIEFVVPLSRRGGRDLGIASTGNFMYGAGVLFGIVGTLGYKVEFVVPAVWKRFHGLLGKTKEASRSLALRHFPRLATYLKRKKDSDRAEALLMAEWYAAKCD